MLAAIKIEPTIIAPKYFPSIRSNLKQIKVQQRIITTDSSYSKLLSYHIYYFGYIQEGAIWLDLNEFSFVDFFIIKGKKQNTDATYNNKKTVFKPLYCTTRPIKKKVICDWFITPLIM